MPSVVETLIGSWKLVALEFAFEDGQRQAAYDDAKGLLIITPDGRFVAIVADNARREDDNARREDDEPSVLFDRMMAYAGRYRLQGEASAAHMHMKSHSQHVFSLRFRKTFAPLYKNAVRQAFSLIHLTETDGAKFRLRLQCGGRGG